MTNNIIPQSLFLSKDQTQYLSLILREHYYLGKAKTSLGKTLKFFLLDTNIVDNDLITKAMVQSEVNDLQSLPKNTSYVYSPYHKTLFKSLEDYLKVYNLNLLFPHFFYKEVPVSLGLPNTPLNLSDLNNTYLGASRCKKCGHLITRSQNDSYFEFYKCSSLSCNFKNMSS